MTQRKLNRDFYQSRDVVRMARDLIGKLVVTVQGDQLTSGWISECEAYAGVTDRASHAWNGRRTARTETMYHPGGVAYVYLCYGLHHMMNVVTGPEGEPHAILIRSIFPVDGIEFMHERRGFPKPKTPLAAGPGTVCQALGITRADDRTDLTGNRIWIEDRGVVVPDTEVKVTPRIGVDYAGDDARLPYRFVWVPGE
ncbi:MAG: DNA-3-methyladenine glycosylase [Bacteroidetes bacterium]|nr:DNA-3-methyladenine glycosylase [Bacteroidota bacterium]